MECVPFGDHVTKDQQMVDNRGLSIGDVAQASGISVFNLRTWERRYGWPAATKLPSGHRRYSAADVERLKLINAALDAGGKISKVIELSHEQLAAFSRENSNAELAAKDSILRLIKIANQWDDYSLHCSFSQV